VPAPVDEHHFEQIGGRSAAGAGEQQLVHPLPHA
jgi:hypothetical protein